MDLPSQFQALVEHSTDVITLLDEDGTVTYESPAVTRVLGYDQAALVGENAFEYIHPDDREAVVDTFEDVHGTPGATSGRIEYRFQHADGSWVWLESVTANRTDTDIEKYVVNSRDVSQRKNWERKLAAEHRKYRAVVEESHDTIGIHQDGRFVYANPQCREMLGYEPGELVGEPSETIIAPEDRDRVKRYYRQRLDPDVDDPPSRYEATFLTKDGERRVGEISATPISYAGEPADLVMVRDVTERHDYEQRLEAVAKELAVLNRVVRHDIRNDMSIILGWAEALEDHVDEAGEQYLQHILDSGDHVVELTQIARDYVDTVTGGDELELESVPLRQIVETELALRRESFPGARFVVDGEVPDVDVRANEMLGSVFRNLINNAVQHNDAETPVVELSFETRDDEVVARVADNGPGIPDDRKEAVFGKGEAGLDSPGTGMGLYLVHSLVDQYDGAVEVADNEPRGAVVTVRLDRAD